jgi:hypothetical protein
MPSAAASSATIFLGVTPGFGWYFDKWSVALQAPLNLLALQAGAREFGGAKVRREDWDEISDYARVIRFLTYGRKEERLYFTINTLRPTTIGHGLLMNNYQPNVDVDRSMTGIEFDAYNDYGGFEVFTGNVVAPQDLIAALVFVKPGSLFSDSMMAKSFSLGVTYAADLDAPVTLDAGSDGLPTVDGVGNLHAATTEKIQALGFDAEIKVVKTDHVDIKPFLDYSRDADPRIPDGESVAGVIQQAIEDPQMPVRIAVGKEARRFRLARRFLSNAMLDRLLLWKLAKKGQAL